MKWFELGLVILTFASGLIWLLDRLFFAKARKARAGLLDEDREPVVVDYARAFFPILAAVLLLRGFVAEPFRIPSSSMMPTLLIGDFILVNKFAYGLRLPVNNKKIVDIGLPERGDVVVFRPPQYPDQDWIKRVVGLPGDRIAYRDNVLYVNGEPSAYQAIGAYVGKGRGEEMTGATLLAEDLGNGRHEVLEIDSPLFTNHGVGEWAVPAGEYFVMGDNRDRSDDSRFWGTLPESQLRGKAFLVWMNFDSAAGGVDFNRIGTRL
ncbi:signal peptidase I [Luteimonas terricola]|uniref:Signal peptidase I n=1 Tax=Luteimonas terricola TaxID=645597 RepID=A0ABQ2E9G9_9GAMM|nr:signal peptidase I [Luteimonas terricola]GGK02275.1 signal peptidase I [Luteimonas terricola]